MNAQPFGVRMPVSGRYRWRIFVNRFNLAMGLATMAIGMLFLLWILATLVANGFAALSPALFTQMTPPPGAAGGLLNAIYGSALIVLTATLVSTPIGILAGIYLAEYGRTGAFAEATVLRLQARARISSRSRSR